MISTSITIVDSIHSLTPNANWVLRGDLLEWADSEQTEPTQAEIDAEIIKLQAASDAQAYSRSREAEYPNLQDCIHAILDNDLDTLQLKRQAVKTKYPKP